VLQQFHRPDDSAAYQGPYVSTVSEVSYLFTRNESSRGRLLKIRRARQIARIFVLPFSSRSALWVSSACRFQLPVISSNVDLRYVIAPTAFPNFAVARAYSFRVNIVRSCECEFLRTIVSAVHKSSPQY
jgi:hypothetical protein